MSRNPLAWHVARDFDTYVFSKFQMLGGVSFVSRFSSMMSQLTIVFLERCRGDNDPCAILHITLKYRRRVEMIYNSVGFCLGK